MKMKIKIKNVALRVRLVVFTIGLLSFIFPSPAAVTDYSGWRKSDGTPQSVMLSYYDGPDTRGFAWQTSTSVSSGALWLLKGEWTSATGNFDTNQVATATSAKQTDCYTHKAQVTGLSAGTWSYRLGTSSHYAYGKFVVRDGTQPFVAVNITDIQLKSADKLSNWKNVVKAANTVLDGGSNADTIISCGDFFDQTFPSSSYSRYLCWGVTADQARPEFADVAWTMVSGNHDTSYYKACCAENYNSAASSGGGCHSYDYGCVHVATIPYASSLSSGVETWLKDDLAAAQDAQWRILVMHFGPYTTAEYKVKDNAAEVKLTVNRTAKDGKVRVKLWTEHGTNSAGTVIAEGVNRGEKVPDDGKQDDFYKFYHNQQMLEWANGDNKAKTVIIKLIPDKYPTFHDFVRFFKVRMEDAFDGSADCYHASFAIDSKTKKPLSETQVTFQESAKKTPGTVQIDDKRQDVKKPVFNVRAGETLCFNLVRVGGDDGAITVKVDASALTGHKGDSTTVEWADGETGTKMVSVAVPQATDAKTSKKVTLKLSATSKDKPKFAASSITVNVSNDKFAATLADYAKALPKTCGYTIKEGKSGTWVVADNGDFVSTNTPSALTFTITGPALFSCKLNGVETNVAVTVVGKTQTFVVPAGVKEVTDVKYLFNGGAYETVYQAVQYGYDEPISTETAAKLKVSVGKLPDGIKLEQDKASKAWYVRGVPTKTGYFFAEIQDAQKNVLGTNAFEVVALRSAIGTFNGLAEGASTNNLQSFAQVTLTTATSGKLSAKVAIGGKTYSFAATGFSRVEVDEESSVTNFIAELTQLQKVTVKDGSKSQSLTYTNMLTVTIGDRDEADMAGWRSSQIVDLNMAALPDLKGSGFQKNVYYAGRAYRDNSKQAAWVTEAAQYAGYYTIALVPQKPLDWEPQGNGYLTLTLDAKGKVKIAGALPNGTAYSASSVVGNLCTVEGDCAVSIPLYSFKNPTFFGGWLTLRFKEAYKIGSAVTVLDEVDGIHWISQDAAATYDGSGFDLTLEPVGGYYDTVANLQRYYLNNRFEIEFPADDDLNGLREILEKNYGKGYDFVAKANPNTMPVDVIGDTMSVAKQVLVKEMDGTKKTSFNDWSLCTNAANVKVTFKRATGIITGTCDLWYEGMNGTKRVQNAIKSCKHAGVLLMSWDADNLPDSFDKDTWTAGAVVIPQSWKDGNVTRKWNASFPFNIKVERFED